MGIGRPANASSEPLRLRVDAHRPPAGSLPAGALRLAARHAAGGGPVRAPAGVLAAAPEMEAVKRHLFDSPAAAVAAKPTAIVKPRKEGSELSGWYIY